MRIPNAANRFRFAESGDVPQAVSFRNEVTVHHGSAMLGKHEKLGVRFDYRQGRALPRSASNSASGAAFIAVKKAGTALSRAVSGKHDTAITMSEPIARSAFSMLRTPPSMYRSPFIVIGGQIPGTAVLAANARSNGARRTLIKPASTNAA